MSFVSAIVSFLVLFFLALRGYDTAVKISDVEMKRIPTCSKYYG